MRGAQRRETFAFAILARAARRKILQTLDWVTRFLWYLARAARRKFCFCNPGARSAEKNFATLGWVTRILWYLARAARSAKKILLLQPWRAQRGENFCNARLGHPFSLVSGARSAEKISLGQHWAALMQKTRR